MAVNVFVVCTPLQLINALEAQHAFEARGCVLVTVESEALHDRLRSMIDPSDWDEVHHVMVQEPTGGWRARAAAVWRGAQARRGLDQLARRWPEVDRLFLGNYNDVFCRHLSNVLSSRAIVLLDDGTTTIDIACRRVQESGPARSVGQARRIALYARLMAVRTHEAERLVFFTSYDIAVGRQDEVVRNTFERLRAQAARMGVGDGVLFLGQPLVEIGQMLEDRYATYLAAARDHFGAEGFVYVPHWRESPHLVQRLQTKLGFEVVRPPVPIEVDLLRSGRLPRVLASFHTAALENCRRMFGGAGMRITALTIAPEHLESGHDSIERVYAYFRTHAGDGLSVESLEGILAPEAPTVLPMAGHRRPRFTVPAAQAGRDGAPALEST